MEGIVLLGVSLCIYFLPWLFAIVRSKTGRTKVFLVNLAFGWTIIGWFIALGMAFRSDTVAAKRLKTLTASILLVQCQESRLQISSHNSYLMRVSDVLRFLVRRVS